MAGFATIDAAIERASRSGRCGTLVAGRFTLHVAQDPDDIPELAAEMISRLQRWFAAAPRTLWVSGDLLRGQWTILVRFAAGQMALVAAGTRTVPLPLVDLTLFGNHGVLQSLWGTGESDFVWRPQRPDSPHRPLLAALRMAIQTREAIDVDSARPQPGAVSVLERGSATFDLFAKHHRPPVEPPYGVLLVSGDHTHQPAYADAFLADPRCRIVGITDEPTTAERQRLNEDYARRANLRWMPDFREAVQRPDVHVVSICAEPERRARLVTAAAEARKHLYLDKPLCANVSEAESIVRAVRGHRVLAQMFSQIHGEPAVRVREILAAGTLGELQAIHCDLTFAKGHTGGATLGTARREQSEPDRFELPDAKRELTNIGVYSVVMLLALVRRQVRRVFAATGNYFFAEHQQHDLEDFGQMLLELDGGITASVTAGRTGWSSHPAGGLNRVTLVGSQQSVVLDAHRPRWELWTDAPSWTAPPRNPADPMAMWAPADAGVPAASPKTDWWLPREPSWRIDVEEFLSCLQHGRDGEVTVEMAASATAILAAAYRSAAAAGSVT